MKGFWYLATPYSKYHRGLDAAFRMAAREAARLLRAGVPVFCPISHTHPIAEYGNLNHRSHDFWLPVDRPMMEAAVGLIVVRAKGWKQSYGIKYELEVFRSAGKPILYVDPEDA